jgi:hypothetical protein
VPGCFEHDNEVSSSGKGVKCLDKLNVLLGLPLVLLASIFNVANKDSGFVE